MVLSDTSRPTFFVFSVNGNRYQFYLLLGHASLIICKKEFTSYTSLHYYGFLKNFYCFSQDVVRKIENNPTSSGDKPVKEVVIKDCGSLPVDTPFAVEKESAK